MSLYTGALISRDRFLKLQWLSKRVYLFLILTGFAILLFQKAETIYISVVYGAVHSCILTSIVLMLI